MITHTVGEVQADVPGADEARDVHGMVDELVQGRRGVSGDE